jgi:hypothetical protein
MGPIDGVRSMVPDGAQDKEILELLDRYAGLLAR